MKPVIIIAIAFVLLIVPLIVPLHAFQFSNEEDPYTSSYRGNDGSINSTCDRRSFHVYLTLNSENPTPIKFEFLNPEGKVVGVYEETMRGSLSTEIDVNYDIEGVYQILLHYKGEIFEVQRLSFTEDTIPSHDEQIQCLVAKAINAGTYHTVNSLSVTNSNYEITWLENKDDLQKILGDELFSHYEPILNVFPYLDNHLLFIQRMNTDLAFEELDKLHIILNDYYNEKYSLNYEIAENQIKQMDISDEDKVDAIFERRVNYEQTVSIFENYNKNFIEQAKEMYLLFDEIDEQLKQDGEQRSMEKAKQEEELESKQKILAELKRHIPNPSIFVMNNFVSMKLVSIR